MTFRPILIAAVLATPALAEETRQLDAHEHGVGQLNIAIDGTVVAMELHAPGADIVGFEHAATSAGDRAAVDAALAALARPLDLFALPAAAGCGVTRADAGLEGAEAQPEHGHGDHGDHGDHADHDTDEDHAEHEDHDHDHQDGHDAAHHGEAGHTEFHAEYLLDCTDPGAITSMDFAYFETFENAREMEVQIVTPSGARAFDVRRADPTLDLGGMFRD